MGTLFFAFTLGGAFWVGVLAARRMRDWGDTGRMLEANLEHGPDRLPAAQPEVRARIRALVAERLDGQIHMAHALPGGGRVGGVRALTTGDAWLSGIGGPSGGQDDLLAIRVGDVLLLELAEQSVAGDYIVEGVVSLREGATDRRVVVARDGDREICVVVEPARGMGLVLEALDDHGWSGEPARSLRVAGQDFALERRGQSSAAGIGAHGRPARARVATYVYRSLDGGVLWLERWGGHDILAASGREVPLHGIRRLPGS
jgi:hypothetical protein